MKTNNNFFKKINFLYLSDIVKVLGKKKFPKRIIINNIKDLKNANKNDLSFFNSIRYLDLLKSMSL